ncbi:MAG TPA: dTMP kinase [Hydrogenispora sp.]|jgi:dTMP kinase|nr:dTMP kinase [Hydrogenispora sp.]
MKQGIFITFEGIDGSGKSTQAQMLAARLTAEGVPTLITREPGGTVLAEKIRDLLLFAEEDPAPETEILLYAAARAQHVGKVIRPALARGAVVICERFTDSTLAYQGFAAGNDPELIRQMNTFATGGLVPDLTFLLDLTPDQGWRRVQERSSRIGTDRIEARGLSFQEKVRQGYLRLAAAEAERFCLLTGSDRTKEEVHQQIWVRFLEKFPFIPVGSKGKGGK